ncbi:hypothetical protein [Streptomyces sp. NBC_01304]|uniref:hypothetical protein n=1 Tax=Streptomyces sp. NBC_01304 TaxID=2903818 RepID=UPI002E11A92C|nr:hypothetical protein OG430_26875 [Streptomyces sp. NBC_01304]
MLVAAGALLGVVAGVCTGYVIQADRKPTGLGPLSQHEVRQAKSVAEAPVPEVDRQAEHEVDLRKLLLKRPKGTTGGKSRWVRLDDFAQGYTRPGSAFSNFSEAEIRRTAEVRWVQGYSAVTIQLVQFREESTLKSAEHLSVQQGFAAEDSSEKAIPGSIDGSVYVADEPRRKAGYLPNYHAAAHARSGDVVMHIYLSDTRPISMKRAMDLAERQWERL